MVLLMMTLHQKKVSMQIPTANPSIVRMHIGIPELRGGKEKEFNQLAVSFTKPTMTSAEPIVIAR
jgi:hypothetical protein